MTSITQIPSVTRRRLGALRRRIGLWIALDAMSLLALAVVALVAASLLLDWFFHLDRPQRLVMLLLMLAAAAHILFHRLLRPLSRNPDDQSLCVAVEHHHPELADQLISALQFAQIGDNDSPGSSRPLMNATIAQSENLARAIDFTDIIDRRAHRRHLARGGAALLTLLAAMILMPSTLSIWFHRNILLSDLGWPQRTHLHVRGLDADGVLLLPRGDDLELHVQADTQGEIPQAVYVDYKITTSGHTTDNPAPTSSSTSVGGGGSGGGGEQMVGLGDGLFSAMFPNVLEEMRFRVRGGDAVMPTRGWYQLRLVDRPAVSAMQLTVDPPAYTQLPPQVLPSDQSAYVMPAGGAVHLRITASKPLSGATIALGDTPLGPMTCDDPARLVWRFTVEPAALQRGSLAVSLTDAEGLPSKRPTRIELRPTPDKSPVVRVKLEGIGDLMTPRALLPIRIEANDDFAVTALTLSFHHAAAPDAGDQPADQKLPIAGATIPAKHVEPFVHRWPVESLNLPTDSQLTFVIEATDNDAFTGPKTGQSQVFSLKVVSDQELRDQLLRREQEQRMEFERLLRDQQLLRVDTQAALADARPFDAARRQQLGELEKKQRLVGGRTRAIADQFAQLLAETLNNQLETPGSPAQMRLQQRIIDPLNDLAAPNGLVPLAADLLSESRKPTLGETDRHSALEQTAAGQQRVIDAMEVILKNMVKLEGFQEAINTLREIRRAQQDVKQRTDQERNKRIEDVFKP
ncbi:MAG: hypothetical protein WC058_01535 [Phycisphaeraceae bacterium]